MTIARRWSRDTCPACRAPILPGTRITRLSRAVVYHADCYRQRPDQRAARDERLRCAFGVER